MARFLDRMPSQFELRVALEVARLISAEVVNDRDLILMFEHFATGGLIRVANLSDAAKLLAKGGLLTHAGDGWRAEDILKGVSALPDEEGIISLATLLLSRAPPMWLAGATVGVTVDTEVIPDADWTALCDAVNDPARREAVLLAVGRRFSDPADLGNSDAAVDHVVAACRDRLRTLGRDDLAARVLRVANDEQLGYDIICPTMQGACWRLKVLTGRRGVSHLAMNVTRDDAQIGVGKSGWAAIACQSGGDGSPRVAGWCRAPLFLDHLPADLAGRSAWTTARIFIDDQHLESDFPDLDHGPT